MNNNNGNLTSMSNSGGSSKTVAAILKQHKDMKREEAGQSMPIQYQHLLQQQNMQQMHSQHLKQVVGQNLKNQATGNHGNQSKQHTGGRGTSPSIVVSPARSPSKVRGISPSNPVTTKSSSLSRDISPSRFTAQIVKVMTDPTTESNPPNLLRSALQGNMPDPMGILTSSKTDIILSAASTSSSGHRKSPSNFRSASPGKNSSKSFVGNQAAAMNTNFSIQLDSEAKGQSELDSGNTGTMLSLTMANILPTLPGSVQTINVSHTPKPVVNSSSTNTNITALLSSSPRPSPRAAMEVAQQIKMEANDQSAGALRAGLQQQLLTQIQGSKSIDAQLTGRQEQNPTQTTGNSSRVPAKDIEMKNLETSMPLLASKLATSPGSSPVMQTGTILSHLKQQQQQVNNILQPPATVTPGSSLDQTMGKKSPRQKPKANHDTKQTLPPSQTTSLPKAAPAPQQQKTVAIDPSWLMQRPLGSTDGANLVDLLTDEEKQRFIGQFMQVNFGALSDTSSQLQTSSHTRSLNSQTTSQSSTYTKPNPNYQLKNVNSLSGGNIVVDRNLVGSNSSVAISQIIKTGWGDSKQTAIDVDDDDGGLKSKQRGFKSSSKDVKTPQSVINQPQISSFNAVKVDSGSIKGIQTVLGHQVINSNFTSLKDISGKTQMNKPQDASNSTQGFTPLVSGVSLSTSNLPVYTSSYLTHIPRPIVHSSAALSTKMTSSMSNFNPPPPYPSKLQQSTIKASTTSRSSHQNPFTFPTTGIKIEADQNSPYGGVSYPGLGIPNSLPPENTLHTDLNTTDRKDDKSRFQQDIKQLPAAIIKAHSDISSISSFQHKTLPTDADSSMPLLIPQKVEIKPDIISHFLPKQEMISYLDNIDDKSVDQPFNQRMSNLSCFPVMNTSYRTSYRSHAVAVQRARSGVVTNTAKSLDILRQNLQRTINKEISEIIKKYTEKYFSPALDNIKKNSNECYIGDEQINYVCRSILEECKSEYITNRRSVTPTADIPDNVSETGSTNGGRRTHYLKRSRISDSDSEKGSDGGFRRKAAKRKGRAPGHSSGRVTPSKPKADSVKREGPKWDPERVTSETEFVMGARANKALGLGNTRGRLYIRHPDVFKYIGDQEDKLWLSESNYMPPTGGKAYMLILEDIKDLSESDEYRDSPGLMMHECIGFTVPDWMQIKIRNQMNALRSDYLKSSPSVSPNRDGAVSRPKDLPFSSFAEPAIKEEPQPSPADTEEMDFITNSNEDIQPSTGVSPFHVGGGFDDNTSSPRPSDIDNMEEHTSVRSIFS